MASLSEAEQRRRLTFGFLMTIWSSSGAMVSIITTLNAAYDVTESRPWWKTRLTAVGLTIALARLHPGVDVPGDRGPDARRDISRPAAPRARRSSGRGGCCSGRSCSRWSRPRIAVVYYFAPDVEQDWVWITPGSVLATVLWLLVSLA